MEQMDHQLMLLLAEVNDQEAAAEAAMATDAPAEEDQPLDGIRLDPVLHIEPAFRLLLLNLKPNLPHLVSLRGLSTGWKFQITELLASQLSLMLFSNVDELKNYMMQLNKYGLREDDFYKIKTTDVMIGRPEEDSPPGRSTGTHFPSLMCNVKKLIINRAADRNLDLPALLAGWAPTLESLVLFNPHGSDLYEEHQKRRELRAWSEPFRRMSNLTRLELYGVNVNYIKTKTIRKFLSRLEHLVVVDVAEHGHDGGACNAGRLKPLLGALVPGRLKHLGLEAAACGAEKQDIGGLFSDWDHGRALGAGLTRLQLGRTSWATLKMIGERCKGLEYLRFECPELKLLEIFTILAPLENLSELRLSYPHVSPLTHTRLPPDHQITTLSGIRRLSLDCRNLLLYRDLSKVLLRFLPHLEQLSLSDNGWNDHVEEYRTLKANLGCIKVASFYWNGDFTKCYPERYWDRFPANWERGRADNVGELRHLQITDAHEDLVEAVMREITFRPIWLPGFRAF